VRLIGIDSPERDQGSAGTGATQALTALASRGDTLQLEPDVSPRDRYGRVLGYLWKQGRLINWQMVRRGWALATPYPPDVRYVDFLEAAEARARRDKVGLWGLPDPWCVPSEHRAGRC
jgi:micrococcal nuclease